MKNIKVLLFGMTGFGNSALNVLCKLATVELVGVVTPKRNPSPYPYYECTEICDAALEQNIQLYEGLNVAEKNTIELIGNLAPDLIIVSSFDQIIPDAVIRIPPLGIINIHPSLLPKYRGATPTTWALMNGEKKTGVTIHLIEDERIDSGKIILQEELTINDEDNDGLLRQRLARVSEKLLADAIERIQKPRDEVSFLGQDAKSSSYYPKRTSCDALIDTNSSFISIRNQIRAMTPYPGAFVVRDRTKFIVDSATLVAPASHREQRNDANNNGTLVLHTPDGDVEFHVKEKVLED